MKKILVSLLTLAIAGSAACPSPVLAQSVYHDASLDTTAPLDGHTRVPNGDKRVSLSVTGENIRTVLRDLSRQAGFNLLMDESVTGNVTVELNNVTINHALDSVAALADIKLLKQSGGIYLAISRQAAQDKGVARQLSKVIKVYYSTASRVADILNRSILADPSAAASSGTTAGGSQGTQKVKADPRTNTLIVVGTAQEIELAEAAVAKLDVPRQSRTFYLSHANALDVATMLSSSIFNDGNAALRIGGSGGSSSASATGGASATPSSVRVERQDVQEGTGVNSFGGSTGSGVSSGLSSAVTLRGFVKASDSAQVSPEGAMVIPDTRQNAVTIMGTAEQIAMAESLIPTLDAQLPQVAIEASLIEVSSSGVKQLSGQWGLSDGRLQGGFNNALAEGVSGQIVGIPTVENVGGQSLARSIIGYSTNKVTESNDFLLQIKSLTQTSKAKVLANPTIVATHDTESIISIVDEIVRRVTTQLDASGFATQTVEVGEAGIVLDILPKIGEDGTINMRLRPSITSVFGQPVRDAFGNLVTLLSKRDMLTQNVRIRDGETLVIGGLIQESQTTREDRLPLAGDLPIVGAMFRASQRDSDRSELMLLITPHILNKTRPTPVNATSTMQTETSLAGGSR